LYVWVVWIRFSDRMSARETISVSFTYVKIVYLC